MAKISAGSTCKIYMELPDGALFEMTSMVRSFNFQHTINMVDVTEYGDNHRSYIPSIGETTIELVGIQPGAWTDSANLRNRLQAPEWKCDFCGRPNEHDRETCRSCGAVRSFIYNL
jgi:hypothetical protein